MRILLVEDDEKVASFLKENLNRDNLVTDVITSMDDLQGFIDKRPFDPELIVLDRLIGNSDTRSVLKNIKTSFPQSRILYLSALNTPNEKAALLDEGADDYLGKPFSLIELQARVRALIRRRSEVAQTFYINVGDLIIDLRARTVTCQGSRVNLKNKEYSLLMNFAQNPGRVFSKFQLLDIIWETNLDVESNVLEVTIMNLRKKLDECNSSVQILSKRNVGYWLET
jgi:DNA-binding response OmpR family regulator